jgi:hypothetical protein
MSPRRGSKPRRTDRLVVGRNVTLTLAASLQSWSLSLELAVGSYQDSDGKWCHELWVREESPVGWVKRAQRRDSVKRLSRSCDSVVIEVYNKSNCQSNTPSTVTQHVTLYYITFPASIVSQNDCRMWNKSYKYNNTYTVHLKHSKNMYTHTYKLILSTYTMYTHL